MLYFAYGANTNHDNMLGRCRDAVFLGTGFIHGFRLVFRGVADIEARSRSLVSGAIWDISKQDLAALDRYEGFPNLYGREVILAKFHQPLHGHGREGQVIVYRMTGDRQTAPPWENYLSTVYRGYAHSRLPTMQLSLAVEASHFGNTGDPVPSRQWAS